ncbi:MAG: CdaR family protein [Spirochaetes bacterium]|nr:CdaR family protein [Spirochaetota bacterium]
MKPENFAASLFSEWPAKVLSLAAALLLILFFNLTRLEQRTINIPLAVAFNEEFAPSSQYPRMVKVVLKGERDVIYGIREDEISASLDLAGFKNEGIYRVSVKLEKHGNALAADPLEIRPDPQEINIGLERRVQKKVPVTPSFKGFLESGYELTSFDLSPSEINVSGPAGLVAQTTEISTDIIGLGGKKTDFSVDVRLLKKNNLLAFEGRESVVFSAKVKRSLSVKNYSDVRISMKGLSPSLSLADALPQGNLRLHVPDGMDGNLDPDGFLTIDLASLTRPGTYTVDVAVKQPEGVIVETYEPQTLTIRLQNLGAGSGGKVSGSIRPVAGGSPGITAEQPGGASLGGGPAAPEAKP